MHVTTYPAAIIVHGLEQAKLALAPRRPVLLLSAPGAGIYGGVGWWQALMALAHKSVPEALFDHMLDCGDSPGRTVEALRAAQKLLVLDCPDNIWADLADRARRQSATVLRMAPPALDLGQPGAERHIGAWLSNQE